MPDAIFDDPRLAQVYDPLDPDRSDLDAYAAMVDEFGARSVLDVGCGTGTFACMLAERGVEVSGVDPAGASLDVARGKRGEDRVRWIHGDATQLPPMQVDLAFMTANVAQVFLTDDDWAATLHGIHDALNPAGRLVFEIRDPARKAWLEWTRENSYVRKDVPEIGVVESWDDVTDVTGQLVTFRGAIRFESDGASIATASTLRFRTRSEIAASLQAFGFRVDEVRDAPDRPGREFVFIASRTSWARDLTSNDAKIDAGGGIMRTTLNLDDALLAKAAELSGITEKAALVRSGLEALVQRESARRLALLGGADPDAHAAPRQRESA